MIQTYDIVFDTPKYHRKGTAELVFNKDAAHVRLEVNDFGIIEADGTREDRDFEVSGVANVVGREPVEFKATGHTWGNALDCTAETSIGTVTVYGTATGHSAGDVNGLSSDFAGRWSDGM